MKLFIQLKKRLRYTLDVLYSRGPGAIVLSLGVLSLAIILASAIVLTTTGLAPGKEDAFSFPEAFWLSLLRALGSGTIGGRDSVWGFRFLMLGLTFGSVFVFSSFIGVLTNSMQSRMDELRKGRSEVMETGHTVILGWSEQIFTILSELLAAKSSEQNACIVILGEQEKVAMEDAIRQKAGPAGRTRIVCRTGNPMEMSDLKIANLNGARSILVLSPESSNPDADVFKVVLAILNHPDRRSRPYHIVACLRNPKNAEIAKVIGKGEVEWVQSGDTISRIIAQTSRQSGLSIVYTELLDFGGNEIYFYEEPGLAAKSFGQALLSTEQNAVIGILPAGQKPRLNPPPDALLQPGDQVIVIARDNRKISFEPARQAPIQKEAISLKDKPAKQIERTLILGWNWRGPAVIRELDQYVAPDSEIMVVADRQGILEAIEQDCQDLINQKVCYRHGSTDDRQTLDDLGLEDYDHLILLSYSDKLNVHQSDAQTLITLLHLRDIAEKRGLNFSIVSEMLDVRNRKLAVVTRADDFIVSDRLISLIMAQISENKELNPVFEDLFDPQSAEIYLRPAGEYIHTGRAVNFYTVVEAACLRNETAIGYRQAARSHDPQQAYGVVLNPLKSQEVTFYEGDKIIVLANS